MKGYVQATIPQRQFENIHIHYDFESEEGKNMAMEYLIADMLKYHHEVSRLSTQVEKEEGDKQEEEYKKRNKKLFVTDFDVQNGITEKLLVNGIEYMKQKGEWVRRNPVKGVWEKSDETPRL